jgi:hypothetical protein
MSSHHETEQHHQQHIHGSGGSEHTFEVEESSAFTVLINRTLQNDSTVSHLLPLNPDSNDLFVKVKDGLILCRFINSAFPGTVDELKINFKKSNQELNIFKRTENLNNVIQSASKIRGIHVVNIGAQDILEER